MVGVGDIMGKAAYMLFLAGGFVILVCVCSGCQNPMNRLTAGRYYSDGIEAERANNLTAAKIAFHRSYANAMAGNLPPYTQAQTLYDWSRISGYLGQFADAEWGFRKCLNIATNANGRANYYVAAAYIELARLYQDTGRYSGAADAFNNGIVFIDSRGDSTVDPGAFADILEDYARVLSELGRTSEVVQVRSRLASWRAVHPEPARYIPRRYKQ